MITWSSFLESSFPKILQILAVLAIFFGFYGIAFAAGARIQGKKQNILALSLFLVPAIILAMTGLGIPAVQTFIESFKNADSSKWVGLANYTRAVKDPDILLAFRNTMAWVIISPLVATSLGLALATMLNKMLVEVEDNILFSLDPDPGTTTATSLSGTYTFKVILSSKMPSTGISIDITTKTDPAGTVLESKNVKSTIASNEISTGTLVSGSLYSVTVAVTSQKTASNTLTKTFKVARK